MGLVRYDVNKYNFEWVGGGRYFLDQPCPRHDSVLVKWAGQENPCDFVHEKLRSEPNGLDNGEECVMVNLEFHLPTDEKPADYLETWYDSKCDALHLFVCQRSSGRRLECNSHKSAWSRDRYGNFEVDVYGAGMSNIVRCRERF